MSPGWESEGYHMKPPHLFHLPSMPTLVGITLSGGRSLYLSRVCCLGRPTVALPGINLPVLLIILVSTSICACVFLLSVPFGQQTMLGSFFFNCVSLSGTSKQLMPSEQGHLCLCSQHDR